MAEKPERRTEEKAAPPAAHPAEEKKSSGIGSLVRSTPMLLAVVMLMEAGVLFIGFKFFGGGPQSAHGADLVTGGPSIGEGPAKSGSGKANKRVELSVINFKAPNSVRGRTYLYDVCVYIVTKAENKDALELALKEREATIQDRIRTIIAQSDPEKLSGSEPGLETLRRQVKYQLDEIIRENGENLIDEVLIPRCIPYRAEF